MALPLLGGLPPQAWGAAVTLLIFFLGFLGFVFRKAIGGSGLAAAHAYRLISRRVTVSVITSPGSRYLSEFFRVYESAFSEEERFSTQEINEWLERKAATKGLDYRLLIARRAGETLGIAIYIRLKKTRTVFLPYLALSDSANASRLSQRTIAVLFRSARPFLGHPHTIIFEVEHPDEAGLSLSERKRRVARVRRFGNLCKSNGICIKYPRFSYWEPPFRSDAGARDGKRMLLGVLTPQPVDKMSREELLSHIALVYNIYAICVPEGDPSRQDVVQVTHRYLERYTALPSVMPLDHMPALASLS